MKTIKLGNSELTASNVALGIMRMDQLTVKQAAEVLTTAKEAGITYIDSADIYGEGESEKRFSAAMKEAGFTRDDFLIQSKGGIIVDPTRSEGGVVFGSRYDFSKQHLLEAVDGILTRLNIDYLDSFLLHRPDPLMEVDEIAEAFDELQTSGKVRHFGVSNFNPQQIELVQSAVHQRLMFDQLQFGLMHTGMIDLGMHTNMADDDSVDHNGGLLEYAQRKGMTVQAWSPYQYGMFEGPFIDNPKFPELNEELQKVADAKGVTKNAIATAWILRHPAKIQVILGSMNPQHIKESAAGSGVELTKQEWYDLYFKAGHILP
ncbi:aldo/keto reductase [Paucilactobacillus suebicus]|uniref:Aldo keto reductase family oxidoreductase n=1 Tax=Paucilactobacillus suebicus DSM 5007 = KCTC 3549 TaxID=1423807 RepID=A0A0R1W2R4_9LACO|nr:aldo/keto reductase [Paucilactobacillus suebicus]KRM11901.1 aldo keto reductase family oxidoreductase [Paucilactobacillus suebicus DSM 5007 = KCTC 3549]